MKPVIDIVSYDNGNIQTEIHTVDGKYHRLDGPAIIGFEPDGSLKYTIYFIDGARTRLDGPAAIEYKDGQITKEWYSINDISYSKEKYDIEINKMNRQNGEVISRFDNKKIVKHYKDGKLHKEDGPAILRYEINGAEEILVGVTYFINDKIHRIDGPASINYYPMYSEYFWINGEVLIESEFNKKKPLIKYDTNGNIYKMCYFNDAGVLHRDDGPAYISITDGIKREQYHLYGKYYNKEEYYKAINTEIKIKTSIIKVSTEFLKNNKQRIIDDCSSDTLTELVLNDGSLKNLSVKDYNAIIRILDTPIKARQKLTIELKLEELFA